MDAGVSCVLFGAACCWLRSQCGSRLGQHCLSSASQSQTWSKAPDTGCFGEERGAECSGSGFWLASQQLSTSPGAHMAWGAFVNSLSALRTAERWTSSALPIKSLEQMTVKRISSKDLTGRVALALVGYQARVRLLLANG